MALLELLARAAPAGVVAPDLVAVLGGSGLDDTVPVRRTWADGFGRGHVNRSGRPGRGGFRQGRGLHLATPGIVKAACLLGGPEDLLGLRGRDIDLDVEDQAAELLPDR